MSDVVSGYVPVGSGIGAAVLADGRLNVVAGPLFAQIERERRDGPLWCWALAQGRRLTSGLFYPGPFRDNLRIPANSRELSGGIPIGWVSR